MTCNSSPVSCNRQPFLTDSSCDRGNVDIHQFDDLPFCDPINPTMPDIPPEVVDTPLNLPIPPACACIHVDYDIGFKYIKEREFSASTSFSAKSDCCEGLYVSKINLQVPCPVTGSSSPYRLRILARYGKSSASPTSYFVTDPSSCTFTPLSATLKVNVPCPVSSAGPFKLRVKAKYDREDASPTSYFITNPDSCTINPLSATLKVNVPCPVSSAGPFRLKVKARYDREDASPTSYFVTDPDSCTINPLSATLKVNVPCPVSSAGPYKLRVKAKYSKDSAPSVSYFKTNPDSCTISPLSATLRVNIPCPIISSSGPYKLRIVAKYGSSSASAVSYMRTDNDRCIIKPYSAMLKVNVPCPLPQDKKPYTIRAKAKYSKDDASSVSYLETGGSSCTINPLSPTIQVNVPCPVPGDSKSYKIKAKAVYRKRDDFSSASAVDYLKVNASSCGLNFVDFDAPLKVNIPCPVGARDESPRVCVKFEDLDELDPTIVAHGKPFLDCWGRFKVVLIRYDGTTETVAEYNRDNVVCIERPEQFITVRFSIHGDIPGVGFTEFATYDGFWGNPTAFTTGEIPVEGGCLRIYGMTLQGEWVWAGSPPSDISHTAPLVWCSFVPKIAELPCGVMVYDEDAKECLDTEALALFRAGSSISAFRLTSGGLCGISAKDKLLATFGLIDGIWTATSGTFCVEGMQISSSEEITSIHLIVYEQADDEEKERGGQMFMSIKYGKQGECGTNAAVAKFVEVDNDACAVNYLSPNIRLSIPCPMRVKKIGQPRPDSSSYYLWKGPIRITTRNYFYIPYESSSSSSSSSFDVIGWARGDCDIVLKEKTVLNIPPTISPFFMDGDKIKYKYIQVGRNVLYDDGATVLSCLREPHDGLKVYAKISYSKCSWSLEVDCGDSLPENSLTNTYRLLYFYDHDRWIDCRWMPTIVAMD